MKKIYFAALLSVLNICSGYSYSYKPGLPVNIYLNSGIFQGKTYYTPSCWQGDIMCISYAETCSNNPNSSPSCIKIDYIFTNQSVMNWIGINWSFPSYNWGDIDAGLDLTGASRVTFFARGEKGQETIAVKFGGNFGLFPDSTDVIAGPITLTKEWKQYEIPIQEEDLTHISMGFGLMMFRKDYKNRKLKKATVYLDDIIID
ncbi:MAG: hypothetical protein PHF84_06525 [bacterium]|nr:hypothetical protein [bacterium]